MNNRDIAKVGFAVLAAVMSYNFADTIFMLKKQVLSL